MQGFTNSRSSTVLNILEGLPKRTIFKMGDMLALVEYKCNTEHLKLEI